MAEQTKCKCSSEWYAKQIRDAAEYLLKNAEELAKGVDERQKLVVTIDISPDCITSIEVAHEIHIY